ncbi:transcriptional regulator [Frondihabitans sp. PAMC 28766]|uniref:GAF and ANTAR domain-containing protein n=1 Tax=Frondihabitans sp. PAMC 28766 TaxID=1795630 RepID=UPI00078E036F|nr:GAF and ANTAR domain-containing protein [Frondihabitans sp. PAMC 28766]AMM22053.1 transcriptional regulator [Frondihabitans sp. PAMC 28766]
MSDRGEFLAALSTLSQAAAPRADLCGPFLRALPVAGASVSTLGDPLGSATVCSSDERAARLDEIQIDLGEGPCWDALVTDAPVLAFDVQTVANDRWPVAAAALRETGLEAVFAFPLSYGRLGMGAVDLYADKPVKLSDDEVSDASTLANVAARHVLHRAVAALAPSAFEEVDRYSRREVHQASGMVSAQLTVDVDDALLVLRGHAFATDTPLREIAADVVARRLDFSE